MMSLLETYLWTLVLEISNLSKINEKQHKTVLWSGAKLNGICVTVYKLTVNVIRTSKKVENTASVSKNMIRKLCDPGGHFLNP